MADSAVEGENPVVVVVRLSTGFEGTGLPSGGAVVEVEISVGASKVGVVAA